MNSHFPRCIANMMRDAASFKLCITLQAHLTYLILRTATPVSYHKNFLRLDMRRCHSGTRFGRRRRRFRALRGFADDEAILLHAFH